MNAKKRNRCFVRRFMALALILSLLASVSACKPKKTAEQEQELFDAFTNELFASDITENIINLHWTLAFPENYGIEDYEISFGDLSEEYEEETFEELRNVLKELNDFDYELLSKEQKLTFDILKTYAEDNLKTEGFRLYYDYLSPTNGVQSYLPTLLAEYKFYKEQDVKDYLDSLRLFPDYFANVMAFEQEQADAGFFMPDFEADKVIDQCQQFMEDPEHHYLIDSFNLRLEETDFLEEADKESYREENRQLIQDTVIPAYGYLVEELSKLKGSATNDAGLYYFENGREFYRLLVRDSTGSDKSVEELEDTILDNMQRALETIWTMDLDGDVFDRMLECPVDLSDPYEVLELLKEGIAQDFPVPGDLPFEVNYVPASMEEYMNPAYYILPPIDYLENNVIYINNSLSSDDIEQFVTLAHEGFPGHLFQTTYFYGRQPSRIRKLFGFSGYSEGWGTYAEIYAYQLSGIDDDLLLLNALNKTYTLSLYCLADIGINYEGWTLEDTQDFLGIDEDTSREIYEILVEEPALYLAYYGGYLEFMELREKAEETLGEKFNLKDFHTFLLDVGPAQFEIIEEQMEAWMEEQA
ncbi:MAG: DUF885 domain-containing protein [Lachnospiraceae bacterium]|jgi:uncharacterized protein (DUF885 family)|nr:DUF885 domain-containing protein [Lachnospiraceae bacterium]